MNVAAQLQTDAGGGRFFEVNRLVVEEDGWFPGVQPFEESLEIGQRKPLPGNGGVIDSQDLHPAREGLDFVAQNLNPCLSHDGFRPFHPGEDLMIPDDGQDPLPSLQAGKGDSHLLHVGNSRVHQVSGENDQVGAEFIHPADHIAKPPIFVQHPVVDIGEMDDRQAIQVGGQMAQGDFDPGYPDFPGFPEGVPTRGRASQENEGCCPSTVGDRPGPAKPPSETKLAQEKTRQVASGRCQNEKKRNSYPGCGKESQFLVEKIKIMSSPNPADGEKDDEQPHREKDAPAPSGRWLNPPRHPVIEV
jgi:hypothetical protein